MLWGRLPTGREEGEGQADEGDEGDEGDERDEGHEVGNGRSDQERHEGHEGEGHEAQGGQPVQEGHEDREVHEDHEGHDGHEGSARAQGVVRLHRPTRYGGYCAEAFETMSTRMQQVSLEHSWLYGVLLESSSAHMLMCTDRSNG